MPKLKRGKNAKKIPNWRGTCPLCGRKRVRILWTAIIDGKAITVCKRCG
jgi:hypothetical protein